MDYNNNKTIENLDDYYEKWDSLPKIIHSLANSIDKIDIDTSYHYIHTNEFQKYLDNKYSPDFSDEINKYNRGRIFDQLRDLLILLYSNSDNFIDVTKGKTVLNPIWNPFIIDFKKKIDSVDSYRYDNEIQF
jgi:hypothetical protein